MADCRSVLEVQLQRHVYFFYDTDAKSHDQKKKKKLLYKHCFSLLQLVNWSYLLTYLMVLHLLNAN